MRIRQTGVPSDETDAAWPIFHAAGQLKSLHANGRSFVLSTEQFNREHKLPKFWEDNEQQADAPISASAAYGMFYALGAAACLAWR